MAKPSSSSSFFEILDIIKKDFEVEDAYVEDGISTFIISDSPSFKEKIKSLRSKLRFRGFEIVLRPNTVGIKLRVFPVAPITSSSRRFFGLNLPLILFILTIVSVAISGYLTASGYLSILQTLEEVRPGVAPRLEDEFSFLLGQTVLYTVSIMSIVGLHELGHTIACKINHVKASLPMFIPGIPGITPGTFGAVITQKEPTRNRDQLFDIGFTGPFVGFITAMVVSFFGYSLSISITRVEYEQLMLGTSSLQFVYLPLIFAFLEPYIFSPSAFVSFLHPLAIAGWMGTLITFLNTFPIGQLDGGHVARAILGSKWQRILSYVMTVVMFIAGWWTMALLVIFFMRFEHPGTLDEVSPISRNRKILAILLVGIFILCFTFSPDSPISFLL